MMKRILIILSLFLLIGTISHSQDLDCARFRTGTFILEEPGRETTIIKRKKHFQTETVKKEGTKIKLKVEWLDNCTYKLSLVKIKKNKSKVAFNKKMVLTVRIVEIKGDTYVQKSNSNKTARTFTSEITKIR